MIRVWLLLVILAGIAVGVVLGVRYGHDREASSNVRTILYVVGFGGLLLASGGIGISRWRRRN
jgi:hypothetical protein